MVRATFLTGFRKKAYSLYNYIFIILFFLLKAVRKDKKEPSRPVIPTLTDFLKKFMSKNTKPRKHWKQGLTAF